MLNIFKKRKTSEQIIAEIHNEFDSASEKLLQDAKDILLGINTEKANRLKMLGFYQSKPVEETASALELKAKNEELAKNVNYYKQWYPNNKFITEQAVASICKKYGLVFGDVAYYTGDVPEKNLKEMEQFHLRQEDKKAETYSNSLLHRMLVDFQHRGRLARGYDIPDASNQHTTYTTPPFKICAPKRDFDMSKLREVGYKLELNIEDPIVLQPVKGGYLIVTKWGLEASDDLVKNEVMN